MYIELCTPNYCLLYMDPVMELPESVESQLLCDRMEMSIGTPTSEHPKEINRTHVPLAVPNTLCVCV